MPVRAAAPVDAPIGVFDSGIGGLTVLAALVRALPNERFIYLGDTARLPYGTKSGATVTRYAVQAAAALLGRGVKLLVVACNTAASVGLDAVRAASGAVPAIGVIEPGAQAAAHASPSGRIAVIATEATVRGGAYRQAILRRRPGAQVTELAAQLLVAMAEEGVHEGPLAHAAVRHYLGTLFDSEAAPDTLVLGCTHFPLLRPAIRDVIGPGTRLVDSAETTAAAVHAQLQAAGLARVAAAPPAGAVDPDRTGRAEPGRSAAAPSLQFLATDSPERFARVGGRFLGRSLAAADVELVDL
ncbi:MAG TPA: glutamate racemase [Steroidobacteraceae bacterium]|nr:glutamate racemase [Steroidobacteraceae bacterium]